MRLLRLCLLLTGLGLAPLSAQQPTPPPATPAPTGRITGRVVDRETGRPVQGVRVMLVGQAGVVETDLDGRYRTPPVAAGLYSVRAMYIGYNPVQRDSIRVVGGQTVTVDFALTVRAVELDELAVEAVIPVAPKTDAGLLAAQQAAPSVSDGISAEAISRSPDGDGGDVIRRVTGVAVFDRKFVVVRGLNERYSTTTLNGADLPSPEPLKKVAPLDIFPASLLESIVTAKTATPDKPGDFAGGAVEVRTKDFPENPVFQIGVSQGFNSQTTFQRMAMGPRTTADFFGFGDARRRPNADAIAGRIDERALESYRNVWTGHPVSAAPNLGLSINFGGQVGETTPIGFSGALTYGNKRAYTPGRLLAYVPNKTGDGGNGRLLDESVVEVEWGALANLSVRLGSGSKIGWKNLYTRNAEETLASGEGYNTENNTVFDTYGVQYVERELLQTQLTGEHLLPFFFNARLDWKGTLAWARRREPDQRRANYVRSGGVAVLTQFNTFQTRDLDDRIRTGQLDLTIPLSLRREADAAFKMGGVLRDKPRTFTSSYTAVRAQTTDVAILSLPPEQLFAPENMGTALTGQPFDFGGSYDSDDDLTAAYGMLDLPLLPRVRLVGGVRMEHWRLNVFEGGRAAPDSITFLRPYDFLWSANLTWSLTDQMNVRLAGFRSLTRPDPRELINDRYLPVGTECELTGDPTLRPARILNLDARWEFYPRAAELFAVSGFYKKFTNPLVEVIQETANTCFSYTANGEGARNYGLELEARRALDFLPGALGGLALSVNATILHSEVELDPIRFGASDGLGLQGQSPFLLNGSLSWASASGGTSMSLLFNYFASRIARYGGAQPSLPEVRPPNVLEQGRHSLDAKVQQVWGPLKLSLSGTNLTGQEVRWVVEGTGGRLLTRRARLGTSYSFGVTYDVF